MNSLNFLFLSELKLKIRRNLRLVYILCQIQNALDSDIAMSFDECPPASAGYNYMKNSIELRR